jgi:8-amino-7-oxononanoate synthase
MGTFSKALASLGGYVAGPRPIISWLQNKARSLIYTTALPPAIQGVNLAALDYLAQRPQIGRDLLDKAQSLRASLQRAGLDTGNSQSQIIPVILGQSRLALEAQAFLRKQGLFVPAIRSPTVPRGQARLRLSVRGDLESSEWKTIEQAFFQLGDFLSRATQGKRP